MNICLNLALFLRARFVYVPVSEKILDKQTVEFSSAMAETEESLEERQENEVEVLKSIYDIDFEDLRVKDVWKVRRPPEFILKMKPDHDSRGANQEACVVDLHVSCHDKYPLIAPTIQLINAKGVSDDLIQRLQYEVTEMARSLVGEVMVMDSQLFLFSFLPKNVHFEFILGDGFSSTCLKLVAGNRWF